MYVYMCIVLYISVCLVEAADLFSDGSGSGGGNLEFFLPAVHQHGKLLIIFSS